MTTLDSTRSNANNTISANLRTCSKTGLTGSNTTTYCTTSKASGKFIFSAVMGTITTGFGLGMGVAGAPITDGAYIGQTTASIMIAASGSIFTNDGNSLATSFQGYVSGDRVWVAHDFTNRLLWTRPNNGTWNNSGTAHPDTGVGGIATSTLSGTTLFAGVSPKTVGDVVTMDFTTPAGGDASTFATWDTGLCRRALLGVGCGIWAAKKIEENPTITRRGLIIPGGLTWR